MADMNFDPATVGPDVKLSSEILWIVIVGFIVAFMLAFGIGANDVANSFGTSVGSKVLTLFQACMLATIFEIAGAVLIGYKVSDTMRKGILDVTLYANGGEKQLALGCLAALIAGAAWLLTATALALPVSGTHSVVGAVVGFTLTAKGFVGIRWTTLGAIVMSWFISPVMSGLVSSILFWLIRTYILRASHPVKAGLRSLPFFYGCTVLINVLSVIHDGPKLLKMDNIPFWLAALISVTIGLVVAILVQLFLVPHHRNQLQTGRTNVSFTIGQSNETTPNMSPTKFLRPSTLIEIKANHQPKTRIETSEMATMPTNGFHRHPALLATFDDCSILSRSMSPPERIQPKDPCLRYIDETLSFAQSVDSSQLASGMGDSYKSEHGFFMSSCETLARPVGWTDEPKVALGVTPNSSAVPLIAGRDEDWYTTNAHSTDLELNNEPQPVLKIFSFLQVLTATFGGFAHGGNDVSNAIGPLIALWLLYSEGGAHAKAETPLPILLFGGVGISAGLWIWGRRVIKTVGEDLTTITPDTGFTIELGAALTVLLASKVGIPVSTTHCKVGSVVCVGSLSSTQTVDWALFRNIIFAWVVTVPVVAALSAFCMYFFNKIFIL